MVMVLVPEAPIACPQVLNWLRSTGEGQAEVAVQAAWLCLLPLPSCRQSESRVESGESSAAILMEHCAVAEVSSEAPEGRGLGVLVGWQASVDLDSFSPGHGWWLSLMC